MQRIDSRAPALSLGFVFASSLVLLSAASFAQDEKAIDTGKAAGIGALIGFALGGDPIVGAASGAALGAAGGMIANEVTKGSRGQQDAELEDRDRRIAELETQLGAAERARANAQEAIIEAVGPDVWEGYKSLRGCQFQRAEALAKVGAVSEERYHQLGAVWLQAMIAVDQNDLDQAQMHYQTLVAQDPEIQSKKQAAKATDKAVQDMRGERRSLGIGPCAG